MQRILALVFSIGVAHGVASAQADPLSSLRFLIGEWQAVDTPPGETGAFTFKLTVQDRVIVRTNEAVYTASADHPASRHDDLMVIYSERASVKADYFDNEGHVIRYTLEPRAGSVAVFVSEPNPSEPRYRLTYTAGANGLLRGSFEIAPPGAKDAFKPYLSWTAQKR